MSVDGADDVVDAAASTTLRRTLSETVHRGPGRTSSASRGLGGSDGFRALVTASKSEQTLCSWKQSQNVAGCSGTKRRDTVTSGKNT